jgi:hypothetical protein
MQHLPCSYFLPDNDRFLAEGMGYTPMLILKAEVLWCKPRVEQCQWSPVVAVKHARSVPQGLEGSSHNSLLVAYD